MGYGQNLATVDLRKSTPECEKIDIQEDKAELMLFSGKSIS